MKNNIDVRLTKAIKKGRKVIIEFESDLFSNEVFCHNVFYDEGDDKNQLQSVIFNINAIETNGEIKAQVYFGNYLSHFTKGHSQMHSPLKTFFRDKKEATENWFKTDKELKKDDVERILGNWEHDKAFQQKLKNIAEGRKAEIINIKKEKAQNDLINSINEYYEIINNLQT